MDRDAAIAIGTALTALVGLLERKGVCTSGEVVDALADAMTAASGEEPPLQGQGRYLGMWAYMVKVAGAEGKPN